ncbi:Equilibrative nucleoside transporter 1 [Amphibalanus amphitrite]|uniref:Equilibrative nucleoside transporter 1 n=1 Tax=Amphibalanus amphitrite TaxID=1232801 RepID=A0A6A4WYT3_AMPAM|nr:Equilibrative nucleoside transporter 1 [Amphibalanus amphitrite]
MGAGSQEDVALNDDRNGAGSPQHLSPKEVEASMIETHVEPDAPKIIYYIFYLLGMGTLLPWNFFITADSVSTYTDVEQVSGSVCVVRCGVVLRFEADSDDRLEYSLVERQLAVL